jgi:hypothetical protein
MAGSISILLLLRRPAVTRAAALLFLEKVQGTWLSVRLRTAPWNRSPGPLKNLRSCPRPLQPCRCEASSTANGDGGSPAAGTDRRMDGRTDGRSPAARTGRQMDGQTDGRALTRGTPATAVALLPELTELLRRTPAPMAQPFSRCATRTSAARPATTKAIGRRYASHIPCQPRLRPASARRGAGLSVRLPRVSRPVAG